MQGCAMLDSVLMLMKLKLMVNKARISLKILQLRLVFLIGFFISKHKTQVKHTCQRKKLILFQGFFITMAITINDYH